MAALSPWHDYGTPRVSQLVETINELANSCRAELVAITTEIDRCLNRKGHHSDAVSHATRPRAHADLVSAEKEIEIALRHLMACRHAATHAKAGTPGGAAPPAPPEA